MSRQQGRCLLVGRRLTAVQILLTLAALVLLVELVQPAAAHPHGHSHLAKATEEEDDFYLILGLEEKREDATERDIRAAWRKLSKMHHPDVASVDSEKGFYQRIQRAYEVLGDRKKRKVYDIFGMEGVTQLEQPQQAAQGMHPLMQFFGFGGGGGGGGGVQRGEDMHMLLVVPLEDLYVGAAHTVEFSKTKVCRACRGTGARRKEDVVTCPNCQGRGRILSRVQVAPGFIQQVERVCPHCEGKGKHIAARCPLCRGAQVVRNAPAEVSVDVEAGLPEGHTLTFEMEADQTPGVLPGDLILTVTSAPHAVFRRDGDNLHATVALTLKEALLGFRKTLAHLDGHEVVLEHDGAESIQYGQQHRIRGDGMPRHHVPSEKGDLIVTYEVKLPTFIRSELRDDIRQKLQ